MAERDQTGVRFPVRYRPTVIFRAGAIILAVGAVYLGSEVWKNPDILRMIFFGGVAFIALWMASNALAKVEFDGQTLTYRVPLRAAHRIHKAQIDSVSLEGRRTEALVIIYHPQDENGRIDSERLKYLNLAPLENQGELYDFLAGISEDGRGS
ncbi:MAG: hypothetical protein J5I90_14700 [Caldilineales bacterium]|nr:hypothetical protein [Caldilineales bacterium]